MLFRRSASTPASTPPPAPPAITHRGQHPARLEVETFATSKVVLEALVPIVGTHPYPLSELMLMAAAFFDCRPARVIDIGTHHGKSARIWHELGQLLNTPPHIHTIDLCDPTHPEFPGKDHGRYCRDLPNVTLHTGDGADTTAKLIDDDPHVATLVFLDGDHARETVTRELNICNRLSGASILLHDTLTQPNSGYNEGPYEALTDFLATRPDIECHHTHLGLPGMTLLRLPAATA
ncbi:MAG: CmcI family methyltransferase [Algisphaera sp.]